MPTCINSLSLYNNLLVWKITISFIIHKHYTVTNTTPCVSNGSRKKFDTLHLQLFCKSVSFKILKVYSKKKLSVAQQTMRYNSVHSVPSNLNVIKAFIYFPKWGRKGEKERKEGTGFQSKKGGRWER